MKLYKTTIKANSNFATTLKGDTIFGQICWYIELLKKGELKKMLENYDKKPFLIVSDAFISGYLPKPKMPSHFLGVHTHPLGHLTHEHLATQAVKKYSRRIVT